MQWDREPRALLFQVYPRNGRQLLGGKSGRAEQGRELHREAPRVGRADELLRIRPLPIGGAGPEVVRSTLAVGSDGEQLLAVESESIDPERWHVADRSEGASFADRDASLRGVFNHLCGTLVADQEIQRRRNSR